MEKRLNLNRERIVDLYVNQKISAPKIAKILNVGKTTIYKRLIENNIIRRSNKIKLDLNKIRNLYLNQKKTSLEIGKIFGVSDKVIIQRLKEMNIKRRRGGKQGYRIEIDVNEIENLYVNQRKTVKEVAKILDVSCKAILLRLRKENIKRDKISKKINLDLNKIRDLYINEGKNTYEIAKIMKVSNSVIQDRLNEMEIKMINGRKFRRLNLDIEKIKDLYLNQKKSVAEIGKIFGLSQNVILNRLKEERIEIRPRRLNLDGGMITNLYLNQKKSITEIGELFGVNAMTIFNRLKEEGIKIRKRGRKKILNENKIKDLYVNQNKSIKEIEKILAVSDRPIANILKKMGIKIKIGTKRIKLDNKKIIDLYLNEDKSTIEIGRIFGVTYGVIIKRLKENGIKIKKRKMIRENNGNWRGGKSCEIYGIEFNKKLKEQIRIRDNHTCQECGKKQEELRRLLNIHHVDYNKKNNKSFNLISLCDKCHAKTNGNRKHWKRYFQNIMALREIFNPENLLVFNENKQLIGIERIG